MTPFLKLQHIGKRYGGVQALAHVDLDLFAGEMHCLVGENGSGKSTLIKIVSGVVRPEPGGTIAFQGQAVERLSPADAKHHGVQVIYQDFSLFPNLTVAENITFDRNLRGPFVDSAGGREAAAAALERITGGLDLDDRLVRLPIAQRQLVAIAPALAAEAHLLNVVRDLKRSGLCVVFVSHRLDEIQAIADHATVLRDGRKVGTYPATELYPARVSELMTGEQFTYGCKSRLPVGRRVVLEVVGLTRAGRLP